MDLIQTYASSDEGDSDDLGPNECYDKEAEKSSKKLTRRERNERRNHGQSYLSSANKIVPERQWTPLQACRKDCCSRVTREDQECTFNSHWLQGTYQNRVSSAQKLIEVVPKQRVRKRASANKSACRKFSIKYFILTDSGKVEICKKCFLQTLGETDKFIRILSNNMWSSVQNVNLRRKKRGGRKLTSEKVREVNQHIDSFPKYESHYGRSHTKRKYLSSSLNVSKMYKLYREKYVNPVSESAYKRIFRATKLKFKFPQIDTCSKCDRYNTELKYVTDPEKREEIQSLRDKHLKDANEAYDSKRRDKERASKNINKSEVVCCFDLQQCMPTPKLNTSDCFYLRQLWTYNLTITNMTMNTTSCYMWHESTARRGANDVGSCMHRFLRALPNSVEHATVYSDNCSGQNKNKMSAGMFSTDVHDKPSLKIVDHKFLITGHTHMECDSDHATIERSIKRYDGVIETPEDWYNLVRYAGKSKTFEVHVMEQNDFYDFGSLFKNILVGRNKDVDGNDFSWTGVRWLRYTKEFGQVMYKNSLSEEEPFKTVSFLRKSKPGKDLIIDQVPKSYDSPIGISKEKKKNLESILHLLDPENRKFYSDLPVDQKVKNTDPDIPPDDDDEISGVKKPVTLSAKKTKKEIKTSKMEVVSPKFGLTSMSKRSKRKLNEKSKEESSSKSLRRSKRQKIS